MPDLDQRFRSLDRLVAPNVHDDIERRATNPSPPLPDVPTRARVLAAVVAFVVFALAVGLGIRALRDRPVLEPAPAPGVWATFRDGVTELPPIPDVRTASVQVWTGKELVAWGGDRGAGEPPHYNDGWAFDVSTQTWRPMAASPLSPRSWSAATWSGREVLIWGGGAGYGPQERPTADGAAYDPATDAWHMLPPAPLAPSRVLGAVWTGTEMVIVTDDGAAAFAPDDATWRAFDPAPMAFDDADVAWTGHEVVVYGEPSGDGDGHGPALADGVSLNAGSGTWTALPRPDLPAWRGFPGNLGIDAKGRTIAWDGARLVVADYGLRAAALDEAAGTWMPLPPLPMDGCEDMPSAAAVTGLVMVEFCGQVATLVEGAERWHVVFGGGESPGWLWPLPADDAFLLIGTAFHGDEPLMFLYKPPAPSAGGDRRAAFDVASAFAGIRAGYPYDADNVPPGVLAPISSLLTPEAMDAFADPAAGLHRLWAYYYGFEVLRIEGDEAPFEVVIRLERSEDTDELLTIGPGVGADGQEHDLVILGVEPADPYVAVEDGVRIGVLRHQQSATFEAGDVAHIRCEQDQVAVPAPGRSVGGDSGWLNVLVEENGEIDADCYGP